MIKVLFVCHGNICRSPMAEFVLKDLVKKPVWRTNFLSPLPPPARRRSATRSIRAQSAAWPGRAFPPRASTRCS